MEINVILGFFKQTAETLAAARLSLNWYCQGPSPAALVDLGNYKLPGSFCWSCSCLWSFSDVGVFPNETPAKIGTMPKSSHWHHVCSEKNTEELLTTLEINVVFWEQNLRCWKARLSCLDRASHLSYSSSSLVALKIVRSHSRLAVYSANIHIFVQMSLQKNICMYIHTKVTNHIQVLLRKPTQLLSAGRFTVVSHDQRSHGFLQVVQSTAKKEHCIRDQCLEPPVKVAEFEQARR